MIEDYYLDVNYMFNKYNITTIINYTNLTNRFNKPEDIDQTGVMIEHYSLEVVSSVTSLEKNSCQLSRHFTLKCLFLLFIMGIS